MRRTGPRSAVINSAELTHGWTFERQVRNNPAARREFADLRAALAAANYYHRANQWAARALRSRKPEYYRYAAYALERARQLEAKGAK